MRVRTTYDLEQVASRALGHETHGGQRASCCIDYGGPCAARSRQYDELDASPKHARRNLSEGGLGRRLDESHARFGFPIYFNLYDVSAQRHGPGLRQRGDKARLAALQGFEQDGPTSQHAVQRRGAA